MSDILNDSMLIEEINADYLKYFENWLSNSGINPYIARIMQLLRSENRPLTQKEMKEYLGLSLPTISRNLKVMEQLQLLKISAMSAEGIDAFYQYELKENSLIYIINTFIRRTYDSFKQRIDDNKTILEKIKNLSEEAKTKKFIGNLTRIINEEAVVFDAISGKFEKILQDLENEMANSKSKK